MQRNQFSLTALMSAYVRAHHSRHDTPKVFDDFLAYHIIPQENRTLIEQALLMSFQTKNPVLAASCPDPATALGWAIREMPGSAATLSRSRYAEDKLREAVEKEGIQQYVLLGAGMDTFAFRHPELMPGLQVFEVDHPATQALKRDRLQELGWKIPTKLHFIPLDLAMESLAAALAKSPYDPLAGSFFSWLGVSMYLTQDEVLAILGSITDIGATGSIVVFDYLDPGAFVPKKTTPRFQGMLQLLQQAGEPMKTGLDPLTLGGDLSRLGLSLRENLSPADIEDRYFQGRQDGYYVSEHLPLEHLHLACAAVEGTSPSPLLTRRQY